MITKNPMQLKAFIKRKAEEKNISAQLVMQNYMMERLLERISLSGYKRNFILKGGFLIAAIVGLDTRATMDLDTTVKGFPLTHESIRKIFEEVCSIKVEDDVTFSVTRIADIREGDDYTGLRVNLAVLGQYESIAESIRESPQMHSFWERYQKDFDYAKDISFDDACHTILLLMNEISGG